MCLLCSIRSHPLALGKWFSHCMTESIGSYRYLMEYQQSETLNYSRWSKNSSFTNTSNARTFLVAELVLVMITVCFISHLFCKGTGIYFTRDIGIICLAMWWVSNNTAQADGFTYQYIVHLYQNSIYENHIWSPIIVWGLNCTVLYDPLSR